MNDLALDAARRVRLGGKASLANILATLLTTAIRRAGGIPLHLPAQRLQ